MEAGKMASPKSAPKDAQVMAQILKDTGITEYEPRVINQMLEFAYRYVTTILEDAKIYSSHAKKSSVDADDVRLAIQCRTDQSFTSPPPRDFLLDIARQKNQTPLPLIKPYSGPRLPPDRYCLTAPNYRLKSLQKKVASSAGRITVPRLSVGAVTSRPSTPTLGKLSLQFPWAVFWTASFFLIVSVGKTTLSTGGVRFNESWDSRLTDGAKVHRPDPHLPNVCKISNSDHPHRPERLDQPLPDRVQKHPHHHQYGLIAERRGRTQPLEAETRGRGGLRHVMSSQGLSPPGCLPLCSEAGLAPEVLLARESKTVCA
ncbi:transcription initiation factor TFIID subunit 9 isoform 1-T1 [Liasis olivaceus]